MVRLFNLALAGALALGPGLPLSAQSVALKPFRTSPPATLTQGLGLSTVSLTWHRPAVNGRTIWGGLVPFGEVWRAGANDATTLTLSHPATLNGKPVPAGTYALFILPRKDGQTWILNRQAKQWGSYAYKAEEDLLRVDAPIRTIPSQERLRFTLEPLGEDGMRLEMAWADRASSVDLTFDSKGLYWVHLEETLAKAPTTEWLPWFQAANYCWQRTLQLDKAHGWLDTSLKAKETYSNLELKARFMHRLGKRDEALQYLEKALGLAEGKTPKEYMDGLRKLKDEWKTSTDTDTICPKCLA